jgi:hypothetical protein
VKGHNYGLCRKCGKVHIHPFNGKPRSREWGDNISKTKKGMCVSEEQKEKTSKSLKKLYENGERTVWNIGKTKYNNESVKRISDANIGHIPWNKGKTNVYSQKTLDSISNKLHIYFENDAKYLNISRESDEHKTIKNKIANEIRSLGMVVETERFITINGHRYAVDVYAKKQNGDVMIFEVGNCKKKKMNDLQTHYSLIFHVPKTSGDRLV